MAHAIVCAIFIFISLLIKLNIMGSFLDIMKSASPIASVGSSLLGGIFGNIAQKRANEFNARENQKNRDFAAQQAELSYQRQRTLIGEQREYDSAVQQRQRLEAAGLNPYLMMDGGSAGSSISQSAPQAAQPSSIPMQAQRFEWLQNMAMQAAQIANINANTKKIEADTNQSNQTSNYLWTQAEGQKILNEANDTFLKQLMKSGIDLNDSQRALNDANRVFTSTNTILSQRQFEIMTPLIAGKTVADTVLSQFQAYNLDINSKQGQVTLAWLGALYGAQYSLAQSQISVNNSNAAYTNALTESENMFRIPRLWNFRFQNNLLKQNYNIGEENLKQSKWQTYFLDRTQKEFTENYIQNMRHQYGAWRGYDASFWDKLYDKTQIFSRDVLIPLLGGASNGMGFGFGMSVGQNVGQTLSAPARRPVGFKIP